MSAGHCMVCKVTFLTAEAWFAHLDDIHKARNETVCPLCGEVIPTKQLLNHPCVGDVFGAAR